MKLRLLIILLSIKGLVYTAPPETTSQEGSLPAAQAQGAAPAPLVSLVVGNESKAFETLYTLVDVDEYFGNKNGGAYYPQFIPVNGKVTRETFTFDPGALAQGPNVYPFIFTYKGDIYYIVFVTSTILTEKSDFPFFATIVKLIDIEPKSNSAEIETIANLYFNQNDTLAVLLAADKLEFYNVTQKTKAGFVNEKEKASVSQAPQSPRPQLIPKTVPKPPVAKKKKVLLQPSRRPVAAKRLSPLLRPKTTPKPARTA